MATFGSLIKVIFCYNSAKYEANFVILFLLLLLEMIWALNLLKHFPPHFSLVKLVTFDIIPILLIFWDKVTAELMWGKEW